MITCLLLCDIPSSKLALVTDTAAQSIPVPIVPSPSSVLFPTVSSLIGSAGVVGGLEAATPLASLMVQEATILNPADLKVEFNSVS
jgi:hypothetical protein